MFKPLLFSLFFTHLALAEDEPSQPHNPYQPAILNESSPSLHEAEQLLFILEEIQALELEPEIQVVELEERFGPLDPQKVSSLQQSLEEMLALKEYRDRLNRLDAPLRLTALFLLSFETLEKMSGEKREKEWKLYLQQAILLKAVVFLKIWANEGYRWTILQKNEVLASTWMILYAAFGGYALHNVDFSNTDHPFLVPGVLSAGLIGSWLLFFMAKASSSKYKRAEGRYVELVNRLHIGALDYLNNVTQFKKKIPQHEVEQLTENMLKIELSKMSCKDWVRHF